MITLPQILKNKDGFYEGDLAVYFKTLLNHAKNLNNPYHNLRHMLHIAWLCYDACVFYEQELTPRQRRNLLIAALFHDFNHSEKARQDSQEISQALEGLRNYLEEVDRPYLAEIEGLIKATEYPHKVSNKKEENPLSLQIIRDADLCQGMSEAWLQQVIIGLGSELDVHPKEMLERQIDFYRDLSFSTAWAQERYPLKKIEEKIREAQDYLSLLA